MPFCNQCGHENSEGSRFCSQCGAMLPGADRPAAPAQPQQTPGVTDTAMLTPIGAEPEPEQTGEPLVRDGALDPETSRRLHQTIMVVRRDFTQAT